MRAVSIGYLFFTTMAPAVVLADPQNDPAVIDWIQQSAIPLTTVEAGHGFDDLQPLKKIVGNARIVALGEATHGTREFFQLKHRIVEFLATEMGFTIFSMEANMPEAYRLNDFVLNGRGDPAALLHGMYFWTWDTREVLDMILWMREFNQSGKGRIEFTGFDMQTPDVARQIVSDFVDKFDPAYAPVVRAATPGTPGSSNGFARYTGAFPAKDAAGKTVRFSARIRTRDVTQFAGMFWQPDGMPLTNLQAAAPTGTTDWKRYSIEAIVPANARNISFGVSLVGEGTAWFQDLAIEIDGQPYNRKQGFDLIAADRPAGNFPVAPGYIGSFAGGTLQIVAGQQLADAPDKWQEILHHLESSRPAYRTKGASDWDIAWAAQNAQIVLQAIEMRSGGGPSYRDLAMAHNVKWILDHSPDTKIVLWAHNQHVSFGGHISGYKSMGAELHDLYGDQMRVLGFAFNEGSFQAMEQNQGLRTITVPPMPPGSLDATLAASGIPIFALDLAHAPAWFATPHKSRTIGSMYFRDHPADHEMDLAPRAHYDAILFIERTHAAIPLLHPWQSPSKPPAPRKPFVPLPNWVPLNR